jgi:hypothetical protein
MWARGACVHLNYITHTNSENPYAASSFAPEPKFAGFFCLECSKEVAPSAFVYADDVNHIVKHLALENYFDFDQPHFSHQGQMPYGVMKLLIEKTG